MAQLKFGNSNVSQKALDRASRRAAAGGHYEPRLGGIQRLGDVVLIRCSTLALVYRASNTL